MQNKWNTPAILLIVIEMYTGTNIIAKQLVYV